MGPSASGKMMVTRMTDKERNDGHAKAGKAGTAKDADEKSEIPQPRRAVGAIEPHGPLIDVLYFGRT